MTVDTYDVIWKQFGAAIDMLENVINACPEKEWDSDTNFWYLCYHTLFWMEYYLSEDPLNFSPLPPYTLSEFDPKGAMPDRVYKKQELLQYLEYGRKKCYQTILNLKAGKKSKRFKDHNKDYSLIEILLYNMRHVQHHAAQLNLILRQQIDDAPRWVSRARKEMP